MWLKFHKFWNLFEQKLDKMNCCMCTLWCIRRQEFGITLDDPCTLEHSTLGPSALYTSSWIIDATRARLNEPQYRTSEGYNLECVVAHYSLHPSMALALA